MELKRTLELISGAIDSSRPHQALTQILESAKELVLRSSDTFSWTDWRESSDVAIELDMMLEKVKSNILPEQSRVNALFAPNGPLQEISFNGNWGHYYLEVADQYDQIAHLIWAAADNESEPAFFDSFKPYSPQPNSFSKSI